MAALSLSKAWCTIFSGFSSVISCEPPPIAPADVSVDNVRGRGGCVGGAGAGLWSLVGRLPRPSVICVVQASKEQPKVYDRRHNLSHLKYMDTIPVYRYATHADQASMIKGKACVGIASRIKGHQQGGQVIAYMLTKRPPNVYYHDMEMHSITAQKGGKQR